MNKLRKLLKVNGFKEKAEVYRIKDGIVTFKEDGTEFSSTVDDMPGWLHTVIISFDDDSKEAKDVFSSKIEKNEEIAKLIGISHSCLRTTVSGYLTGRRHRQTDTLLDIYQAKYNILYHGV